MITRLIAETLTPIVTKSRVFRVQGARGIISNRPYLELETPARRRCHTTLIVKQGANRFPVYFRAHSGYLHVDFKARTQKRATRKMEAYLQLQSVGKLTTWGYGGIRWILHTSHDNQEPNTPRPPRFHILKGLPPDLTPRERQLVMAALLHDLVDTLYHLSKLGPSIPISDPYVRWLCEHHHVTKKLPPNPDLQLLQAADTRTSQYARVLPIPTPAGRWPRLIPTILQHNSNKLLSVLSINCTRSSITQRISTDSRPPKLIPRRPSVNIY